MCPAPDCRADDPSQRLLGLPELAEIKEDTVQSDAIRCSSCGCVWKPKEFGGKLILGYWKAPRAKQEWRPNP
jgi:hypothetical protein